MRRLVIATAILLTIFIVAGVSKTEHPLSKYDSITILNYSVVNSYLHDPNAYTQGLVLYEGKIIEGIGLYGSSSLRSVNQLTGEILRMHNLSSTIFGEGVTVLNGKIYQLTWKNNICFVYDADSFKELLTFSYGGEGWGLTTDGVNLIMSDGSSKLLFINPSNFTVIKSLDVMADGVPVARINELEYVEGVIYANIWLTDTVIGIDPKSGRVIEKIDFSKLKNSDWSSTDVFNGIAYDAENKRMFVTGKLWPILYEVKLIK
jgi:glutamine cyclotransferase